MVGKSFAMLTMLALASVAGSSQAEEIKGRIKAVDPDRATITMAVGTVEQVLPVAADAKFLGQFGKKAKKATSQAIPGGLKGIKEGVEVVVTTETRDARDVISRIEVEGLQLKQKKKKKND